VAADFAPERAERSERLCGDRFAGVEAPDVVGQRERVGVAVGFLFLQTFQADGLDVLIDRRVELARGSGGSSMILRRTISVVTPSKGGRPASSSYKHAPAEYTSLCASTSSSRPSACSGAMYDGVPIVVPDA